MMFVFGWSKLIRLGLNVDISHVQDDRPICQGRICNELSIWVTLSVSKKYIREIYVFGDHFWEFYHEQTKKVQDKIDWVIDLVRILPVVPEKFMKHLEGTDGLYEIRIKLGTNIFRVFCFFDKGQLIILLNGYQKKLQKAPVQEIERAEKLRRKYYDEREN